MNKAVRLLAVGVGLIVSGCAANSLKAASTRTPSLATSTPWSLLAPAPGSLAWERSGGIAGLCQQLVIQVDGTFVLSDTCRSAAPQTGRLTQAQAAQLRSWLGTYSSFVWSTPDQPGTADMFQIKVEFQGSGNTSAPDAVQSMIVQTVTEWASALMVPAATAPAPESGQGIEGRATIGPMCPVVSDDNACPDKPYHGTLRIVGADGKQVAELTTAADGSFSLVLPPGEYTIQGTGEAAYPRAAPVDVSVSPGQFTQILISFDTGIR